jgi:hypothetical protein
LKVEDVAPHCGKNYSITSSARMSNEGGILIAS